MHVENSFTTKVKPGPVQQSCLVSTEDKVHTLLDPECLRKQTAPLDWKKTFKDVEAVAPENTDRTNHLNKATI